MSLQWWEIDSDGASEPMATGALHPIDSDGGLQRRFSGKPQIGSESYCGWDAV